MSSSVLKGENWALYFFWINERHAANFHNVFEISFHLYTARCYEVFWYLHIQNNLGNSSKHISYVGSLNRDENHCLKRNWERKTSRSTDKSSFPFTYH